jgi:hypothetical protein
VRTRVWADSPCPTRSVVWFGLIEPLRALSLNFPSFLFRSSNARRGRGLRVSFAAGERSELRFQVPRHWPRSVVNLVAVGLSAEVWFMFGGCADAGGSRFSYGWMTC